VEPNAVVDVAVLLDVFDQAGRSNYSGRDVITVIAHYQTHQDSVAIVRELLARHSKFSEAEPGCLQFLAHQDIDDPTRFGLYETYESLAAFESHRQTEHFRVNIEQTLAPLLTSREWRIYGPAL
jgi:quinol monooxygenase YgiN